MAIRYIGLADRAARNAVRSGRSGEWQRFAVRPGRSDRAAARLGVATIAPRLMLRRAARMDCRLLVPFGFHCHAEDPMRPIDVVWVGLGGGAGSLLRWLIGRVVGERHHGGFPLATCLINVSGAFVIGYLSTLFSVDWRDRYGTALNAGVLTGVLGGFTTFSSMQLDALKLSDAGRASLALAYLLGSVAAGLVAAAAGATLARLQG